jgi:hypothetical protein
VVEVGIAPAQPGRFNTARTAECDEVEGHIQPVSFK